MNWLMAWWRSRQRAIDVKLLWPSCLQQAETRADAKMVFRVHMEMDPAYSDMTDSEKHHFVESLP